VLLLASLVVVAALLVAVADGGDSARGALRPRTILVLTAWRQARRRWQWR